MLSGYVVLNHSRFAGSTTAIATGALRPRLGLVITVWRLVLGRGPRNSRQSPSVRPPRRLARNGGVCPNSTICRLATSPSGRHRFRKPRKAVRVDFGWLHFAEVMYTGFLALKDDYQRDRYGRRVSTSGPSALQPAGLSAWASVAKCSHTSSYTVASTASGAGTASWSPSRIAGQLRLRLLGRDRHDIPRQPHACQAQDQPAGGVELVPAQAVER